MKEFDSIKMHGKNVKILLECYINKTTLRVLAYHSAGQINFKGKTLSLLSYTQPYAPTNVILVFCDYDAVYTFWYLISEKKFLTPSLETRKRALNYSEDGHIKILRNVGIYLQSTHCHI
jgi:hypothetical protein